MTTPSGHPAAPPAAWPRDLRRAHAPFLRAPEASSSIFMVIFAAACAPLAAGVFFFGWRALSVAGLCILSCVLLEAIFYRVTRTPSLLGRTHAALTGLLLALTLPPNVPWYIPVVGSAFAIIVGKALFGGVGHFLWQPAVVGRLAVAVVFAPPLWASSPLAQPVWPLLAREHVVLGDAASAKAPGAYRQWRQAPAPPGADAFLLPRPEETLRDLTMPTPHRGATIAQTLLRMPTAWDLVCGAHAGGIGETCAVAIIVAGLYLVYRNYVRGHLPGLILLSAAVTAAIAPIRAPDGVGWQWLPLTAEGLDVGVTYVAYHLLSGELMLAAWFLATEMTSRPVTAPAQAIFGIAIGAASILLRLYMAFPIPAYAAVLICNTLTPGLDWLIRPRALGQRWWRK